MRLVGLASPWQVGIAFIVQVVLGCKLDDTPLKAGVHDLYYRIAVSELVFPLVRSLEPIG